MQQIQQLTITHPYYLIFVLLLMPVNWYLDFLKWKTMLRFKELDSKGINFKSFMSGIAVSTVTPNRIGNFLGRMLWFSKKSKVYITLATLFGNFAQFLATLIGGLVGLLVANNLPEAFLFTGSTYLFFILIVVCFLVFYFFAHRVVAFFLRSKQNIISEIVPFLKYKRIRLLCLSFIRFFVICVQYYFILSFFQIENFLLVLPLVMTLFLFTTLSPSLFFGKLMIRESIALIVFSSLFTDKMLILSSSLLLWIINLGIPAIIGGIVLARLKLSHDN